MLYLARLVLEPLITKEASRFPVVQYNYGLDSCIVYHVPGSGAWLVIYYSAIILVLSCHLLACACVVADRNAWNKIDNYCVTLYPWDAPRKTGWGYADHFLKLLTHLWPKSVIFAALFMTRPKIRYPVYDYCSWYSYPEHQLWRALGDSLFENYEKVASSKKHTQHFQSRVLKPYPI